MNKRILHVLNLLILTNVLMVCWTGLVVFSFIVVSDLQDADRYDIDTSPQRILVKAFGEDKRELIRECLREHRENQSWGKRIYVNSFSMCVFWIINGVLGVVSCCLAVVVVQGVVVQEVSSEPKPPVSDPDFGEKSE